jgi:putative Holliday junction resolvase
MKYIGIDYGGKRIGIALSDPTGAIAFPHSTVENSTAIEIIKKEVELKRVNMIIVGDTLSYSGKENTVTKEADAFVEKLKLETGIPVERVWEAGSSIEASRYAPEGESHNDASAAAIILQRYLDTKGGSVE